MIITISGTPGSGKSTVAKLLAGRLGYKHYSTGDYYRKMAQDRNVSVLELAGMAEKDKTIDKELDDWQKNLGKQDNFIIDARLGFYFIPGSFKVYLDADEKTRAERIFSDRLRKERNITLEDTISNIRKREISEVKRYKQYYGIDYHDQKNYDLIVDTAELTPKGVVDKILELIKQKPL